MPNEYEIEIVETNLIDGGIEVFARAWKNGVQLGFGDGTVDVERFRIHIGEDNSDYSWLVVPDELGTIEIDESYLDIDGVTLISKIGKYREDPEAHIRLFLTNIISSLETHGDTNIVPNKIGNTVDTFTAHSADGYVRYDGTNWTTARNATTATYLLNTQTEEWFITYDKDGATISCGRAFFPFDTSSIPDTDTISAATLLVRQGSNAGEGDRIFGLVQASPASATALTTADFDNCGSLDSADEGASRVTMNAADTDHVFTLNATGIGWISKTGYTVFGVRASADLDNAAAPTVRNYTRLCWSENATAAYRPTLTVTHSAGAPAFTPTPMMHMMQASCY